MEYENLLAGSRLVPNRIIFAYAIALIGVFFVCYFFYRKNYLRIFFRTLIFFHIIMSVIIISGGIFLLGTSTKVVRQNYIADLNKRGAFEISFNAPVRRKELTKNIEPYTPGIWVYSDPVYDTHLYRKIIFYPYNRLIPGKEYSVNLSGISNFLNKNSSSFAYKFKTRDVFDVLGATAKGSKFGVVGSFPENGWEGINVDTNIRIRFSHAVEKASAQEHFSLTPEVSGAFSWDGETLVFTPATKLNFETKYLITITRGVAILNGSLLTQEYTAVFTTQNETTKLNVPAFLQKYALSCEIAALRMALSYRGVNTDEDELLKQIGFDPNRKKENIWGNPYVGFVGNIRGRQMATGYGVYWEPIARAANNYRYAKAFENWTINQLTESIQKSTPVIAWISIKGKPATVWTTPTGDKIKAVPDEHAVLVTGFTGSPNNPAQIIVNDPLIGEAYYSRESFEKKWLSLGKSGVLVF